MPKAPPKSYAARLQPIADKGKCGDPEIEEPLDNVAEKVAQLAQMILANRGRTIIHTGAGISTSAGVPDFRGPNGVWTRELNGLSPPDGTAFGVAEPTRTHFAINELVAAGLVRHVVSQNVDGLHVRSGLPRDCISEVHGTAFTEWCSKCEKEWRTEDEVHTIGLKKTGNKCRDCSAELRDMLCDWDSPLPDHEMDRAIEEHRTATLVICCGTSLRIRPAGLWPLRTKRKHGKEREGQICIINLQKTSLDKQAACRVFARVDTVFDMLMKELKRINAL
ncbi:NAD-dependent protein deacetylase sirtuin-6 [Rhizoclosmatium sp. JEL0117]|nr:NAD-dependent protein deacetylase sirtuin-6 [Rhizoclosmatium sp. JEL0117]